MSKRFSGITLPHIWKFVILLIARSTLIRSREISWVLATSSGGICKDVPKNGGIYRDTPKLAAPKIVVSLVPVSGIFQVFCWATKTLKNTLFLGQISSLFASLIRPFGGWRPLLWWSLFPSKYRRNCTCLQRHLSTKTLWYVTLTMKCNEQTFDAPDMQTNLTSLRIACIHRFFISSSSGNLKNPICSPFGPTRPLCVHNSAQQWTFYFDAMFLMMPLKPRLGELGSGLNRVSAIYE